MKLLPTHVLIQSYIELKLVTVIYDQEDSGWHERNCEKLHKATRARESYI